MIMDNKKIKNTTKTILILSLLFVGLKYLGIWIEGFIGAIIILSAGIAGLLLVLLLIFKIITLLKTKNKMLFLSYFVGLAAIFIVIFEPFEQLTEKLKSPIVLYGYCEHTVTSVGLTLRQDKSFEYNAGAFLSKEMYYGVYRINKDTLILNFRDENPTNINNKLIFIDNGLLEIGDTIGHRHLFIITHDKLTK